MITLFTCLMQSCLLMKRTLQLQMEAEMDDWEQLNRSEEGSSY